MRSFSFILALLFALVGSSAAWPELHLLEARKGGKNGTASTKGNSINGQCKQMAKLTKLTELAANQTKLDAMVAKGKLNTTEVDAIKAKAANATEKLATMTANSTLVSTCLIVDAHQKVVGECKQMKSLTKLANLANNATAKEAMVSKKELNATQIAKLDEKIANATTKLAAMSANTTLTDLCTAMQSQKGTTGSTTGTQAGTAASAASGTAGTSAAIALSAQTMPYVLVPMLAGFFAFFL